MWLLLTLQVSEVKKAATSLRQVETGLLFPVPEGPLFLLLGTPVQLPHEFFGRTVWLSYCPVPLGLKVYHWNIFQISGKTEIWWSSSKRKVFCRRTRYSFPADWTNKRRERVKFILTKNNGPGNSFQFFKIRCLQYHPQDPLFEISSRRVLFSICSEAGTPGSSAFGPDARPGNTT